MYINAVSEQKIWNIAGSWQLDEHDRRSQLTQGVGHNWVHWGFVGLTTSWRYLIMPLITFRLDGGNYSSGCGGMYGYAYKQQ